MTFQEALQDPSLSHLHDAIRFLQENEDTILMPKKFMSSLKSILSLKVRRILTENPEMHTSSLKLLIAALTGVNEKIPPEMVLEITAHIIKEWETLTTYAKKEQALQAA